MSSIVQPTFDLSHLDVARLLGDAPDYRNELGVKIVRWNDYVIVKYDKERLSDANRHLRSLVFRNGVLVSFAPPKSIKLESVPSLNEYTPEEFVEGTMVNVFWNGESWDVATRSIVGANGVFNKKEGGKTFREMFMEAMNADKRDFPSEEYRGISFSYVLQHPENIIVQPITRPHLSFVAAYKIDGLRVTDVSYLMRKQLFPEMLKGCARFIVEHPSAEHIISEFASPNTHYLVMGVVFKNYKTGERVKYWNPNYEYVHKLRGNHPKPMFRYLTLRRQQRVAEYLTYFPQEAEEFAKYRDEVHEFTTNLHQYYLECYVQKKYPLKEMPFEYRPHIYALHQLYLHEKRYINLVETRKYVNQLEPAKLMFAINYKNYGN